MSFSRQVYRQALRDNANPLPSTSVAAIAQATKARELVGVYIKKLQTENPRTWRFRLQDGVNRVLLDFYYMQKLTRPVNRVIKELHYALDHPTAA